MIASNIDHPGRGEFPSTHWSLVRSAGLDGDAKHAAVRKLIERYAQALRSHLIVSRRIDPQSADDLLHSFIADKVLQGDIIRHADERRGRFRAFLVVSLNRFTVSQFRADHAQRRWGGATSPLDEALAVPEDDGAARPDTTFDVEWARAVLAQVLQRMEAECLAGGRPDVWDVFTGRVLGPILRQTPDVPYSELVERWNFVSPAQASNVLVTANRKFISNLREVIGAYAADQEEIDEEIRDLRRILANAPRREDPDEA